MFRHILVPIDLHHENRSTLGTAAALAQQNRARVTLLHVIYRVALAPDEVRAFDDRLVTMSRRRLDRAATSFAAKGLVSASLSTPIRLQPEVTSG